MTGDADTLAELARQMINEESRFMREHLANKIAVREEAIRGEAARDVLDAADRLALNPDLNRNGAALARALRNVTALRAAPPTALHPDKQDPRSQGVNRGS